MNELVKARTDLEVKDKDLGRTALHLAVKNGHLEVTKALKKLMLM